MGCTSCKCDASVENTGQGCTPIQEVTAMLIAVPTFTSLGVRNSVPFTDSLSQAYFTALINEGDQSKRWRPLPKMKNIKDERAAATFSTFDDQSTEFLFEGARKFEAMITNESGSGATAPQMKKIIEGIRCTDTSFYIVTTGNQLIGQISADGLSLEPIGMDEQSIVAAFMKKTNAAGQHIALQFNFSASAKDENLRMFDCAELGSADLLRLRGLLDICYELISSTTTEVKIKLITSFGTPTNPGIVPGLITADFVSSDNGTPARAYNETDAANVTITSVENPKGVYELTYSGAQGSGEVITIFAKKDGFDFTCVKEKPVAIP